jgi:hypothetical protein
MERKPKTVPKRNVPHDNATSKGGMSLALGNCPLAS